MNVAELIRNGQELVVKRRALEKVDAVHEDMRVPWTAVQSVTVYQSVTVLDDAIAYYPNNIANELSSRSS